MSVQYAGRVILNDERDLRAKPPRPRGAAMSRRQRPIEQDRPRPRHLHAPPGLLTHEVGPDDDNLAVTFFKDAAPHAWTLRYVTEIRRGKPRANRNWSASRPMAAGTPPALPPLAAGHFDAPPTTS